MHIFEGRLWEVFFCALTCDLYSLNFSSRLDMQLQVSYAPHPQHFENYNILSDSGSFYSIPMGNSMALNFIVVPQFQFKSTSSLGLLKCSERGTQPGIGLSEASFTKN